MAGRGSVRKRGQWWTIRYDLGPDPETGQRRQQRESGFRTRREAEEALTARQRERDTGTALDPTRMTTGAYLDHWLAAAIAPSKRPLTTERFRFAIARYLAPVIGDVPLQRLNPAHVSAVHAALTRAGYRRATIVHTHNVLHNALKQAVRWRLIAVNPCDAAPAGQVEQPPTVAWDTATARRFQAAVAADPDAVLWLLAIATGLRRGELLGLKWADVDWERGQLRVVRARVRNPAGGTMEQGTKGKRARVLDLAPQDVAMLREHRRRQRELRLRHADNWRDRGWVFCEPPGVGRNAGLPGGRPLSPSTFTRRWAAILRATGLPRIRPHDLRHTNATVLLEQGVHPRMVQERLGHATFAETMDRYSHATPTLGKAAALAIAAALRGAAGEGDPAAVPDPCPPEAAGRE